MSYEFGKEGWFNLDMTILLSGLDEQGMLEQKERPLRLNGRRRIKAQVEAIVRKVEKDFAPQLEVEEGFEDIDLVSERQMSKNLARAHRAAARYQKVHRNSSCGDLDKNGWKRSRRRDLNNLCRQTDMEDVIRKHRSTFSDCERVAYKGNRYGR